uniref:ABC transporter domain-containing protein n=1 Tax=Lotharella oceanica TaxID=641309 RepID=A0A7S2TUG5_9EUKA
MSQADRISEFRSCEVLMLKSGGAFSECMLLTKNLEVLSGYTSRIGELLESLGDGKRGRKEEKQGEEDKVLPSMSPTAKELKEGVPPPNCIEFKGVTVGAPEPSGKTRVLIRELDLRVSPGLNVLVTGPNGAGKTSIFRVLAGLWQPLAGSTSRPVDPIMWLPQDPYLVTGTLRDQVTYPMLLRNPSEEVDARVRNALLEAGLKKILDRSTVGLDQVCKEWRNELSGGERQRMAFARLFFHNPKFAVLDEATSAINAEGELSLYSKLLKTQCTIFSIAHRTALRKFHKLELEFAGDGSGGYTFYKLDANGSGVTRVKVDSSKLDMEDAE